MYMYFSITIAIVSSEKKSSYVIDNIDDNISGERSDSEN